MWSRSSKNPLLGCRLLNTSSHGRKGSSYKGPDLLRRLHPNDLIIHQRPHLLMPLPPVSTSGVRISTSELRGDMKMQGPVIGEAVVIY